MISCPSFNELADRIVDRKHFQCLITRQQSHFQINPYKIQKLSPLNAKKIYSQIYGKFSVTKESKVSYNAWQQNQRRVFIWYIIVFVDLYMNERSLVDCIPQFKDSIQWTQLSKIFFDKNPKFIEFQFANILKSKKILWTLEQDTILLEAMSQQKFGKWNEVSKRIFYQSNCLLFKSPKHCRQRWFNHLDESKNKGLWTLQQDLIIFKFIVENGKRWSTIVKQLKNRRTQHMIKNRYNSLISKHKQNKKKRQQQVAQLIFNLLDLQVKQLKRERRHKFQKELNLPAEDIIIKQNLIQQQLKNQFIQANKSDITTQKCPQTKLQELIQPIEQKVSDKIISMDEQVINNLKDFSNFQNFKYYNQYVNSINYEIPSYNFFYCFQPTFGLQPVHSYHPLQANFQPGTYN